jgi:hypothetical protein
MSSINPNNIDGTYPIAGQDNSSQGFRDNFTNIKNNLTFAKSEIEDLQNNAILKSPLSGQVLNNNLNYAPLIAAQLIKTVDAKYTFGVVTGAVQVDWSRGHFQELTTGGDITLSFTGWPASTFYTSLRLKVEIADVSHAVSLSAAGVAYQNLNNIQGYDGSALTFTSTGTYLFEFSSSDQGTTVIVRDLLRGYNDVSANISTIVATNITGTLTTAAQPNITSVGNLTSLSASGTIQTTGRIYGNGGISGTLVTSSQTNITTLGNLTALSANGTIRTTGIVYGNSGVSGTLLTAAQPNITSVGNLTSLSTSGTIQTTGPLLANSGISSTDISTGAIVVAGGVGISQDLYVGGTVNVAGNLNIAGNLTTYNANNLSIDDSIIYLAKSNFNDLVDIGFVGQYVNPGYQHTGLVRDASDGVWKLFANVSAEPTTIINFSNATYSNLKVGHLEGTLSTAAQPNITRVGTLSSLSVTGNVAASYFTGNGALLTGVVATGIGTLSNLDVSGSATIAGNVAASYFTGNGALLTGVVATGIGTLSNLNVSGSATINGNVAANYFTGNGALLTGIQATTVGTLSSLTVTGNVAASYFTGNGALLTGVVATGIGNVTTLTVGNIVNANSDGVGNIGTITTQFNTVFAQATSARYADLAEMYTADAEYAPGTVMCFGGSAEVTISTQDSDRRVAGVVTSNPAYLMNNNIQSEFTVAVALQGRVPVRVRGIIHKGDLMVSAGDGYARAEAEPRMGAVIGKALEDHMVDDGIIEVVVGRL